MEHLITREIGIDMGHRVTFHGSKCRNLHGHRYTIQATCAGPLFTDGEQQGMVIDFGFLKEEMMAEIDSPCDHGTTFFRGDELMCAMFEPTFEDLVSLFESEDLSAATAEMWWAYVDDCIRHNGYFAGAGRAGTKVYIVPFVPTAEHLAKHWGERLQPRVAARTDEQARLVEVKVWETPNCSASFAF